MNRQLSEPNQMQVFPKNSPFLPTRKIGKNNPKAEFIEETNRTKRYGQHTVMEHPKRA